jgi:Right handed beta helix region/Abnormal spindle-like microcephaly-assoc'd, ASPM-SPD-2-Hydin
LIRRFAHKALLTANSILLITTSALAGTIIHVPGDQPTIQAGINAASNGDTVLVAPGTYKEQINFLGKAIVVRSQSGDKVTTIDGSGIAGPVVRFVSGETVKAVLQGFTIQGGTLCCFAYEGGGIEVSNSSPTIISNNIRNNVGAGNGGGININFGSPVVRGNTITGNSVAFFGGTEGGGIDVTGASSAQIIGNTIKNNFGVGFGGGIGLFSAGNVVIINNTIANNTGESEGGGIYMVNESDEIIVQNLITGNSAPAGAGIYSSIPQSTTGYRLINNTIAANGASNAAVVADGFNTNAEIINNLIIAPAGQSALLCNPIYTDGPPIVEFNDAFTPQGTSYDGMCTGFSGTHGNISASPEFVGTSNFRLKGGSPVIDAGDNSASNLPVKDFAGNPRIINGNDLPSAIVDMGAYEFVPVVLTPGSIAFGVQAVGSATSKTVKLTNAQDKVLNITAFSVPTGYSVSGCGSSIAAFKNCMLTLTFHPLTAGTFKGSLTVEDDAGDSPQSASVSGSAQ